VIATANPESYAAAFQLDEALLDRFYAVIPVPEGQESLHGEDVQAMIGLSQGLVTPLEATELARVFGEIQKAYGSLIEGRAMERVAQYLGRVVPAALRLQREQNAYISPRTYSRTLPEAIVAIAAYYTVAGASEPLKRGAADGLRYALATKYQIKPSALETIHQSAEALLSTGDLPEVEKIRLAIAHSASFEERLEYLRQSWAQITQVLPNDEIEKELGELLRGASKKGDQEKLVVLKHALDELGYGGDALRQLDGRLIIALNAAVSAAMPKLARILEGTSAEHRRAKDSIEALRRLVQSGTFVAASSPTARKVKSYLIDLREGDVPDDLDSIARFFSDVSPDL
jgi:hypothetical protein